MKAMIFAAGLGTRFKPWTDKHPKALALVNGKSLLQRNIEYFQRFGITEVVVNVHHCADQVVAAVEANNGWGSTVEFSDESGEVLETGGGLLKARPLLEGYEPFVTINADILTDLDLTHLMEFHERKDSLISFGITDRKSSRNFLFNNENRLCGWANSQTGEQRISIDQPALRPMAYSCVVIFDPRVFGLMAAHAETVMGGVNKFSIVETYLGLAAEHRIMGYDHSGDLLVDVGKPESVAVAEALFK